MNRPMLAVLAGAVIVTGCSALSDLAGIRTPVASGGGLPEGLVLVIGAHQNAPAPSLDQRLTCQVAATIRAGRPIRMVVASGQPWLIAPQLIKVSSGTLAEEDSPWVEDDVRRIQAAVTAARATSPGVDDLVALSIAADAARSAGAPHAELALLDSGLDDRGALDFTVPGILAATPAEVASQLKPPANAPHLHGLTVFLVAIGYLPLPQPPSPPKWRANLAQIWAMAPPSAAALTQADPQ